jgi:hypothetical protein
MWDFFIVLGQVPGTNLQITFNEIVIFVAVVLALFVAYRRNVYVRRRARQLYEAINREFITTRKKARKNMKKQYKAGQRYLAAFKRRVRAKSPVKNLRGIPAAKLHARQRAA